MDDPQVERDPLEESVGDERSKAALGIRWGVIVVVALAIAVAMAVLSSQLLGSKSAGAESKTFDTWGELFSIIDGELPTEAELGDLRDYVPTPPGWTIIGISGDPKVQRVIGFQAQGTVASAGAELEHLMFDLGWERSDVELSEMGFVVYSREGTPSMAMVAYSQVSSSQVSAVLTVYQ